LALAQRDISHPTLASRLPAEHYLGQTFSRQLSLAPSQDWANVDINQIGEMRPTFAVFPESRFGSSAVQEEPASQIIARRLTFKGGRTCLVLSQHCPPLLSPLHSLAAPHSCPRRPKLRRCPPPRRPR